MRYVYKVNVRNLEIPQAINKESLVKLEDFGFTIKQI